MIETRIISCNLLVFVSYFPLQKTSLLLRSLRIWPINGDTQQQMSSELDIFLKNGLLIKQEDLDTIIIIESIERMRSSPRSKHHHEILVVFREEETRELILSYSRSIAKYVNESGQPTAGLRMEVLTFLASTHKLLQSVCVYLKNKYGHQIRRC